MDTSDLQYPLGQFLSYGIKGTDTHNECTVLTGYQCYASVLDGQVSRQVMPLADWLTLWQMAHLRGIVRPETGEAFTLVSTSPSHIDYAFFSRLLMARDDVVADRRSRERYLRSRPEVGHLSWEERAASLDRMRQHCEQQENQYANLCSTYGAEKIDIRPGIAIDRSEYEAALAAAAPEVLDILRARARWRAAGGEEADDS